MSMKITSEKWRELRQTVVADDPEQFMKLVAELARISVAHERNFARRCDKVRAFEQGYRPYLASERIHR